MFFFVFFNVVFLLLLKQKGQNYKYDAFLSHGQRLHFLDRGTVL